MQTWVDGQGRTWSFLIGYREAAELANAGIDIATDDLCLFENVHKSIWILHRRQFMAAGIDEESYKDIIPDATAGELVLKILDEVLLFFSAMGPSMRAKLASTLQLRLALVAEAMELRAGSLSASSPQAPAA